jgi:hypothetical protein
MVDDVSMGVSHISVVAHDIDTAFYEFKTLDYAQHVLKKLAKYLLKFETKKQAKE